MRKRFLSFALALCFAIPCMFFLASCGEKSKPIQNFIMTFEEIENSHVHFVYDTNTVKGGENFTFGVEVNEGYDATKIVVSIDDEEIPLAEGHWMVQSAQSYDYVDMESAPKFPFGRKWVYTIEDVQKNMTVSVDASQVDFDEIEVSVSSTGNQSKFYVLKGDRADITNTEEKIYSASFLGDQDIFDELEISDGKIRFEYGKDLFIKIPEDLVEAFTLKLGEYEITNSFLQESDWVTYRREEEAGKKYVFVEIDYYYFAYSQTIASTPIEPVVENQNLVAVVFDDNPNFSFDYYKLCSSEDPDAILIDGDYFKEDSISTYYEVDGESKRAVFAYVGEAENIEDDPYYEPYTNYDYASKKIAFKISKSNGQTTEELIQNLQFALTPYESQNEGYISVKAVDSGYGYSKFFVVIELPQGYDSAKYLNFVTTIKESYLSEKYVDLDLKIQGAYGADPIKVLSTSAEILYQDGKYYFEKDTIMTKYFSQPKVRFDAFTHTTASSTTLSSDDISEYLLDGLNMRLEDVAKYLYAYSSSEKVTSTVDGVDVDEIWTECGETPDDTCCSTCIASDYTELKEASLVAGYKYNDETQTPDVKYLWLSQLTKDETDPEDTSLYVYQNYYYDYATRTWHEKVGADWKKVVVYQGLVQCAKPNEIDELPDLSGTAQAVDVASDLFAAIQLYDGMAEGTTYQYYSPYNTYTTWLLARTEDTSSLVFAIVDINGTNYYYDYATSTWMTEHTLETDEVFESYNFVDLRDDIYQKYLQLEKTYFLAKVLKALDTSSLTETTMTTELLKILRGAVLSASETDYKAYEISVGDVRFSNVVLIVALGENDAETAKLLVFDFDAYDVEEPQGTDIVHCVLDIRENENILSTISTEPDVFVGMNNILSSGLYYKNSKLYSLSNDDAYGFREVPVFEAVSIGNDLISVSSNYYLYFGSLVDTIESGPKAGYVYQFDVSNYKKLYFKTATKIETTAYNFDMAYYYYDFETKDPSYPLYEFDSENKIITIRQGVAEFNFNYNYDVDNAVITINGIEKTSQVIPENPEFVSNFDDYEIAGDAQEDFEFIEKAKAIFDIYARARGDIQDANYKISEKDVVFDNEYDTGLNDHIKAMYIKANCSVYVTIFESEYHNGYLMFEESGDKWYSVNFERGIPSSLRQITGASIPEYASADISSLSIDFTDAPSILDQLYPGQIMKLIATQLGVEIENVTYYSDAHILEYMRYDSEKGSDARCILAYLTADKVFVQQKNASSYWYEVLCDNNQIPRFLKKMEYNDRELADFGVFDIENDVITISYTGIRDKKSLPHKLIFDSLLESGEVYLANDTTKTFDQYVLSETSLFTHIDKDGTHFEEVNSADEVYPQTNVVFYSEVENIYIEKLVDSYDNDGNFVGQVPSEVYEAKVAHVRDIFGNNIAVEKDGKTFYLYVLNQGYSSFDDADWTLKESQQ